jgi:late competence protein required for DNA uptake (superfamily II DNA/RNA helicase)
MEVTNNNRRLMEQVKQTAVEWLEDQIKNSKYYFKLMAEINSRSTVSQSNIFEQAKEMEKQEIIDAVDGFPLNNRNLEGEMYYKETYGGNKC